MKETFIVKAAWKSVFDNLSDKQAGVLIKAVFEYKAKGGIPAWLADGELRMALRFMAIDFDAFDRNYESRCATNRENGRKGADFGRLGGRPRKTVETPKNHERGFENPENPEKPRTGLENPLNDNDTDNDFFKKEKIQKEKADGYADPFPVSDSLPREVEDDVAPPPPGDPPEDFGRFWDAYGKKRGRAETLAYWRRMSCRDRAAALSGVEAYVAANPDPVYRKDPVRYLRRRAWEDENYLKPEYQPKTERNEPAAEYLPGIDRYF